MHHSSTVTLQYDGKAILGGKGPAGGDFHKGSHRFAATKQSSNIKR